MQEDSITRLRLIASNHIDGFAIVDPACDVQLSVAYESEGGREGLAQLALTGAQPLLYAPGAHGCL